MNDQKHRVVEINGVKIEVDLTTAKEIAKYRVGDKVKVLVKKYSDYESHPGIIIGFDQFKALPTIVIAYMETDYSSASLHFAYVNEKTDDVEFCHVSENDLPISKQDISEKLDMEINKIQVQLDEAKAKKSYFLKMFGTYFKEWEESQSVTA